MNGLTLFLLAVGCFNIAVDVLILLSRGAIPVSPWWLFLADVAFVCVVMALYSEERKRV